MEFNSFTFLFLLLPLCLTAFFLLPKRGRSLFLVAVSFAFYYWSEGPYALILAFLVLLLFLAQWLKRRAGDGKIAATYFRLALALLLFLFIYFKYGNFLTANFNHVRGLFSLPPLHVKSVHLPLGISFFLFGAISCLVDIRRGSPAPGGAGLQRIALYITLFPKLLTGPLIPFHRFGDMADASGVTTRRLLTGVRRFIIGLGKKILIADILARAANGIFSMPAGQLDFGLSWIGLIAFTLQVYFDFSGYSDMAIGLGAMVGFDFPENFRYPYAALSIKEFWSRWHITLSQWFRDYVFLPLAYRTLDRLPRERYLGLRSEHWSYVIATALTMVLCGLWHGAGWGFAAWGLYHAAFMAGEHAGWGRWLKRLPRPARHVYAILVVALGWVLFRAADFAHAGAYFKALAGMGRGKGELFFPGLFLDSEVLAAAAVALVASAPFPSWLNGLAGRLIQRWREKRPGITDFSLRAVRLFYLSGVASLSTLYLVGGTYQPFLYLRF